MAEFYTVVTDKGLEALRNCIENNIPFAPKRMAIGDSNGSYYEPETTQTSLKNQLYVGDIATKGKKGNYLFFNFQVPPSEGDYTIRETGLFDGEGNLLAVAKYPETLKSKVNSTNEKSLIIEIQIQLSNKAINTIIIDNCDNFANINLSNISDEAVEKIKGLCGNVYYEELSLDGDIELQNENGDLLIINPASTEKRGTVKVDGTTINVTKDGTISAKQLEAGDNVYIKDNVISAYSGHDLFDIVQKDHILSFEETEGYELLGSYVYKEALAGSRYGYPDFYNKVVEEYNNATETKTVKHYQSINVTVVGSLAESKGVISRFTANNYAQVPIAPPVYGDDWEYCTKIKLSNNTVISPIIATSVNYKGFQLQVNASGVLQFYLSSNGTSWNVAKGLTGTTVLETNRDYWVKIKAYRVDNIYHYDVMLSADGDSYQNEISSSVTDATVYEATTLYNIGKNHSTNIFNGSIDLKETYFTVRSVRIWEACNFLLFNFKEHSNGHKFFDIANKDAIDEYYNATGTAWYYGVDTENERILLPRNDYYFKNGGIDKVGNNIEAGLPNITGKLGDAEATPMKLCNLPSGEDTLQEGALSIEIESTSWSAPAQQDSKTIRSLNFDASLSNPIYGNSDTVQPASVSVLAYMVVGNVKTTEGYSEVVAQGKEILEQVNEGLESRANLYLSNVEASQSFKEKSVSWNIPDYSKQIEITLTSNGTTTYTAPTDGFIYGKQISGTTDKTITINGNKVFGHKTSSGTLSNPFYYIVAKGDVVVVDCTTISVAANNYLIFAPMKGAN